MAEEGCVADGRARADPSILFIPLQGSIKTNPLGHQKRTCLPSSTPAANSAREGYKTPFSKRKGPGVLMLRREAPGCTVME
jgi:hypothetical protein